MSNTRSTLFTRKQRERIQNVLCYIAIIAIILLVDLPLLAMFGTALKREEAVLSTTSLFPLAGDWSIQNFVDVLAKTTYGTNIINSALVSLGATFLCVVVASLAGYALSRFHGKIFSAFSVMLLILQMFPVMLLLIPMFMLFTSYGMMNSLPALMIFYTANNLAFNIMMVKSFFDSIPRELDESAKVDGCTGFTAFLRVILPLSLPGLVTVAILTFLNCWNEFTFASLLLRKPEIQTLSVGLTKFVQQSSTNWGYMMAASSIAVVPALFFLVFAQRYLVQGMTSGAVKG